MNLGGHIQFSQAQSLAITPQVIQSIKLLQYSQDELQTFLNDQLERNPLIDLATCEPDHTPGDAGETADRHSVDPGRAIATAFEDRQVPPFSRRNSKLLFGTTSPSGGSAGYETPNLEDYCVSSVSLSEHLLSQLILVLRSQAQLTIAAEVVGSLDDDGYLRRNLGEIADKLAVTSADVEAVVEVVQTCSPTGIGARSLSECLRIQLRELGRLTPAMDTLLDHLPLLAGFELRKLEKLCGVDKDVILAMAKEIRRLDPRPGRRLDNEPVLPVRPDVLVASRRDGTFAIELNPDCLPRILVNRDYYSEVSSNCVGEQERRFITDCMRHATWLEKSLDRRAQTILKVATEIVARQSDFLLKGAAYLRPLTLRDIAQIVGMHESTVCRAIANKYMMTSRGMYELKFFFSNSIASFKDGSELSSERVQHLIKVLIDGEVPDTPLSDDGIVVALRRDGINIARRTVAKYRETLHIPASQQRCRQKLAQELA